MNREFDPDCVPVKMECVHTNTQIEILTDEVRRLRTAIIWQNLTILSLVVSMYFVTRSLSLMTETLNLLAQRITP
jgi:hypothetical protein